MLNKWGRQAGAGGGRQWEGAHVHLEEEAVPRLSAKVATQERKYRVMQSYLPVFQEKPEVQNFIRNYSIFKCWDN